MINARFFYFCVMRIAFNKLMVSGAGGQLLAQRLLLWALLSAAMLSIQVGAGIDAVQASFLQRWGAAAQPRFDAWRKLLPTLTDLGDTERLKRVNSFVNQQVQFSEDTAVWGQTDYWATPVETLGRGAGDCEDFAIAKYFTLLQIGVAPDKLRFIYVRAKTGTSDATQAHMVLAFYASPDAEPLVMDNLVGEIKPASRRPDLVPVFSFNSTGVFTGAAGASPAAGGTGRLSRWEDLLRRAKAEGFE
ncbi:COG3672 Predicted transglutaminase-like cysteine proteinase [Comamonadaceae bacterium]|mgnify:FL=1